MEETCTDLSRIKKPYHFLSVQVQCVLHVCARMCVECLLRYEHWTGNCGDRQVSALSGPW